MKNLIYSRLRVNHTDTYSYYKAFCALMFLCFSPFTYIVNAQVEFDALLDADRIDIIKDCTPVNLTFTLYNWDETSPKTLTIDLFLLRTPNGSDQAFDITNNPSPAFSNIGNQLISGNLYTNWQMEIELPVQFEPVIHVITILQTEGIIFNTSEIHFSATDGTETTGLVTGPNLLPGNAFEIGTSSTDINEISEVTGGFNELPSGSSAHEVVIDGTLRIDENYEFYGQAHLYMMPGAKIEVSDGSTLELFDMTIVEGCTEAWEGIEVEGGGTLYMDGSTDQSTTGRVELHDAEIGVFAETGGPNNAGAFVDIYNAVFEDNLVGVATPTSVGPHYINIDIGDVKFRQSAFGLKTPMTGTPIAALQVSNITPIYQIWFANNEVDGFITGIDGENTMLLIHDNLFNNLTTGIDIFECPTVTTGNTFSNMTSGIFAYYSKLLSENDSFEDMVLGINAQQSRVINYKGTFTNIPGAGIYMGSDALHSLTQSGGTFDNTRIGIECRNINIISTGNQMDNASHGYRLYNGKGRSFDIRDNTINASNFGVLMFNWNSAGISAIDDNTINIANSTFPDAAGIRLAAVQHVRPEYLRGNIINIRHAEKGIDLQDCNTVLAIDNTIQKLDATQVWHGIGIDGGSFIYPYCNSIGGATTNGTQRGISVWQATQVRPSCNTLDNTDVGIHFDGMSTHADVRGNNFNDHDNGLEVGSILSGGGIIGVQPYRGNTWNGTLGGEGLVHFGSNFSVLASQFIVNTTEGNEFGTTADPGNFIVDNNNGNNLICSDNNFGCDTPPPPIKLSDFDNIDCAIALDTITLSVFPNAQRWTAQRQLYRSLVEVADSISYLSSCLEDFYNESDTTTVGQFEQIRRKMQALFEPGSSVEQNFEDNYADLNGLGNEVIGVLEELRDTSTTSQDSVALVAELDSLVQLMESVSLSQDTLDQAFRSAWMDKADTLLTENTAITATEQWEHNQRNYNRVWLSMVANGQEEPDTNQLATLESIAGQCPFSGGEAVFQARALLGEGYAYDDSSLCVEIQPLIRDHIEEPMFTAYPNPGQYYVVVELVVEAGEKGMVTLMDMMGRTLKSQGISKGDQKVYLLLDNVPAGMYNLSLKLGDRSSSQLLSVVK